MTVSAFADELADVDFACTVDEELLGDTTCGNDQTGNCPAGWGFTGTITLRPREPQA